MALTWAPLDERVLLIIGIPNKMQRAALHPFILSLHPDGHRSQFCAGRPDALGGLPLHSCSCVPDLGPARGPYTFSASPLYGLSWPAPSHWPSGNLLRCRISVLQTGGRLIPFISFGRRVTTFN